MQVAQSPSPAHPQPSAQSTTHLMSLSSLGTGTADGGKGPLGTGEISLNMGQREVQSMSALGKKPFHPSGLLKEGLIFIGFVLKALESKI